MQSRLSYMHHRTSSGAAVAFVRDGYSNVRIGMLLEIAPHCALSVPTFPGYARIPFSAAFGFCAHTRGADSLQNERTKNTRRTRQMASLLRLNGTYLRIPKKEAGPYNVTGVPLDFSLMYVAGVLSALLGIGGRHHEGSAMDRVMKILQVFNNNQQFMIWRYRRSQFRCVLGEDASIPAGHACDVGILLGSFLGAKVLA